MTKELKIDRLDKQFLDSEAWVGDLVETDGGLGKRRFVCVQSASDMLFAHWIRITPFRNPVRWVKFSITMFKDGASK